MLRTPLHNVLAAAGARLGEYRGAETALSFGDAAAEYAALRQRAGIFDLGWRSKLRVSGPDRVRWMNGMVTNNIADLPLDRGAYCFLLNVQGHILGDMYVYHRGEYLLVDTDAWQSDGLRGNLEKFIIMDDVEIASFDDQLTAIGVQGPQSETILKKSGVSIETADSLSVQESTLAGKKTTLVRSDIPNRVELWIAPSDAAATWQALLAAGAEPAGVEALELDRIARGEPRYGQDIRERELPQETGQQRALHFQKGCYIGQEIVERIRSRGAVHRQFSGFIFGDFLPAPGAKIEAAGKEVGEITSTAALPGNNGGRRVGLGYIRQEAAQSAAPLTVGGAPTQVARLPFENL